MNFIESISNYLATFLSTKVPNDKFPTVEDQIEVYTYGFMVIVGAIFKGFIMVSLALLFGVFLPAMIIMFTFSGFRIIGGGFHFNSYNKCISVSTLQFICSALLAKHIIQHMSPINILSLFIFCILTALYIIFKYVPRDTPNKPITDPLERLKFRKWSLYYITIWAIVMTISLFFNFNLLILSSCFGLLLELFSISSFGYCYVYTRLDSIKFTKQIHK